MNFLKVKKIEYWNDRKKARLIHIGRIKCVATIIQKMHKRPLHLCHGHREHTSGTHQCRDGKLYGNVGSRVALEGSDFTQGHQLNT